MIENNPVKFLLVGIGNEYRSDDGAGIIAARTIREKEIPAISVKEEFGEGTSLMDAWQGFRNVIMIDAVSSGAEPGTIFRIDAKKENIPAGLFHNSTHKFGIAEAVRLAQVMNLMPNSFMIYGIEGKDFSAGTKLTANVRKAVKKVAKQIVADTQI
ncbi:MAG: hydrogenase maturation protease [Bacteroidetes bacterium]|nr:hydrogenase maturation protease [Bacteroidota bacterium]